MELKPLTPAAVEEMLLLRMDDDPRIRSLAERLTKEGEGNPLLILEMLKGLEEEGLVRDGAIHIDREAIAQAPLPVPRPIAELIQQRLLVLSDSAQTLAQLVSVARQEVDIELLLQAWRGSEDDFYRSLEELLEAEILCERRVGSTERFAVSHLRIRDVLIERTPDEERRSNHGRIGVALERVSRRNIESIVEQLAHHFECAGVSTKAYPYLIQAGKKLAGQAFPEEAMGYFDRALALEAKVSDFMPLVEAEQRYAELILHRAKTLHHLGRWSEAEDQAHKADTRANQIDDDHLMARTATELARQCRTLDRVDETKHHIKRALSCAVRDGDPRLRIIPLYESGAMMWRDGELSEARKLMVSSLSIAEEFNDAKGLAFGANGLGVLAMCEGRSAEARRYFDQAIATCEKARIIDRLAVARTNVAELSHCMGNFRKGLAMADRTINRCREVRHEYGVALGLRYRALILGDLGRFVAAEEAATQAATIQQNLGNPEEELASNIALIRAILPQGKLPQASELLEDCLSLAAEHDTEGYLPVVHAWRARIQATCGQRQKARDILVEAQSAAGQSWPHQRLRYLLNAARGGALVGDLDGAAVAAQEALRVADGCGYRYYAMRARLILADRLTVAPAMDRHAKIAQALARSLAANLSPDDAESFLSRQGFETQPKGRLKIRSGS